MADARSVGTEVSLPELVAENGNVFVPRLVFSVGEGTSKLRRDAEHVEIVGRYGGRAERLGLAFLGGMALRGQAHSTIFTRGGHIRKHMVHFTPSEVIWRGDGKRIRLESPRWVAQSNHPHALGFPTP